MEKRIAVHYIGTAPASRSEAITRLLVEAAKIGEAVHFEPFGDAKTMQVYVSGATKRLKQIFYNLT